MTAHIRTEIHGPILSIVLDRPKARNAFDRAMADALEAIVDRYDADPALRVAILSAEGPTFCAGQDLIAAARGEIATTPRRGGFGIMGKPPEKPLIAAVEGQALAGGMELTLCCDMIVAANTATFGLTEVRRGLVPAGGGCFRLPRRIPYHIAMEMVLTAEPRGAHDMARLGYVNAVVAPGQALDAALAYAATIARNGPVAVRAAKQIAVRATADQWSDADAWERQQPAIATVMASQDLQEGLRAFAERREPVWTGR